MPVPFPRKADCTRSPASIPPNGLQVVNGRPDPQAMHENFLRKQANVATFQNGVTNNPTHQSEINPEHSLLPISPVFWIGSNHIIGRGNVNTIAAAHPLRDDRVFILDDIL